jgi:uncharacterized membrane protein YbhN (UPF0104 family)
MNGRGPPDTTGVPVMTTSSVIGTEPEVTPTHGAPVAGTGLHRSGRLRQAVLLACAGAAITGLLQAGGGSVHVVSTLQAADAGALVLAAGFCALTFLSAAVAQRGAVALPLPLGPLVAVQVACAFTNRLLPGGVGTFATNGRYLRRAGLSPAGAAAAVTLNGAMGFVVHVLALGVAVPRLLTNPGRPVHYPLPGWDLAAALAGAGLLLIGAGIVVGRRVPRVSGLVTQAASALRDGSAVLRSPRKVSELVLGSGGVTVLHAVAFSICIHAVGGTMRWFDLVAVYLVGAALAAVVPTPGGLGALEASLVLGLVSLGMPTVLAAAGVLWFRLLSFWAPTVPGVAAFGLLLRTGRL